MNARIKNDNRPIAVRSFWDFISNRLPAALVSVAPLADYHVEETAPGVGRISITFALEGSQPTLVFDELHFPRPDGTFAVTDHERVIVMTADSNDLEAARISAVGDQLMAEIGSRLMPLPVNGEWDEVSLRAWLPLDRWLHSFLRDATTSQYLDRNNALSRQTHIRRIVVTGDDVSFHPSHIGRVCPLDTPEGPNNGTILTLANGADVQDGKIVPTADRKEGALSPVARLVPLLCHNDSTRQLMGINMMRQWLPLPDPEPPLVRSGLEPEDGTSFLGRNLLTAFCHWKGINDEDAVVVSQSAAVRLASPEPLDVGDKLSNRHGTKGVVGAILPDDEMPHLPDGRAVDLVFDSMGLYSRLNFGQVLEAILGMIAEKTSKPVVASPFRRTTSEEVHGLLQDAGLPESGQVILTNGKDGAPLVSPTSVGPVYWGKLIYRSRERVNVIPGELHRGMRIGTMEYLALLTAKAYDTVLDAHSIRTLRPSPSVRSRPNDTLLPGMLEKITPTHEESALLMQKVAHGYLAVVASSPSPALKQVQTALRTAIGRLSFLILAFIHHPPSVPSTACVRDGGGI